VHNIDARLSLSKAKERETGIEVATCTGYTGYVLSSACHRVHVFPPFSMETYSPSFTSAGYMSSHPFCQ